jgi:hypothetical protein
MDADGVAATPGAKEPALELAGLVKRFGRRSRWTTSTWSCPGGRSSGWSAPTAPARRPRCRWRWAAPPRRRQRPDLRDRRVGRPGRGQAAGRGAARRPGPARAADRPGVAQLPGVVAGPGPRHRRRPGCRCCCWEPGRGCCRSPCAGRRARPPRRPRPHRRRRAACRLGAAAAGKPDRRGRRQGAARLAARPRPQPAAAPGVADQRPEPGRARAGLPPPGGAAMGGPGRRPDRRHGRGQPVRRRRHRTVADPDGARGREGRRARPAGRLAAGGRARDGRADRQPHRLQRAGLGLALGPGHAPGDARRDRGAWGCCCP